MRRLISAFVSARAVGFGAPLTRRSDGSQTVEAWIDGLLQSNPGEAYVIARISIWARWIMWAVALGYWLWHLDASVDDHTGLLAMFIALALATAAFHWRLITKRPITAGWFLAFTAIDVAIVMVTSSISSAFQPIVYLGLFPSMASVAVTFSSLTLCTTWTSLVAAVYVGTTLAASNRAGIDSPDTIELAARIAMMFAVTLVGNTVTGFERTGRLRALEREQSLQHERIELSQRIHDTTAQSAYMIGLGIDNAIALAGDDRPDLRRTLTATSELSRTAMWELRQPIDMGLIFEGQDLTQVLGAHARNFTTITSIPAELVLTGSEPPLEPQERARILSIAHNALTNAHRHAHASSVTIELEFTADSIRLSVRDDGDGLPEDYRERGHGFKNMRAEAGRLQGVLDVESGGPGEGTTVSCCLPVNRT